MHVCVCARARARARARLCVSACLHVCAHAFFSNAVWASFRCHHWTCTQQPLGGLWGDTFIITLKPLGRYMIVHNVRREMAAARQRAAEELARQEEEERRREAEAAAARAEEIRQRRAAEKRFAVRIDGSVTVSRPPEVGLHHGCLSSS
jgi:hypothetical protein